MTSNEDGKLPCPFTLLKPLTVSLHEIPDSPDKPGGDFCIASGPCKNSKINIGVSSRLSH